ncbi:unnamed protein product, partial [Ectocarpus sp. 12 AP-2014]
MVGTSYLKWTHTVPKSAKKFVSKLSAEDSVFAVAVVRANADLSDEQRQSLLTPGNVRLCVTKSWGCADSLVRQLGQQVLPLFRYGCSARSVRRGFFARERDGERRKAREMSR